MRWQARLRACWALVELDGMAQDMVLQFGRDIAGEEFSLFLRPAPRKSRVQVVEPPARSLRAGRLRVVLSRLRAKKSAKTGHLAFVFGPTGVHSSRKLARHVGLIRMPGHSRLPWIEERLLCGGRDLVTRGVYRCRILRLENSCSTYL